MPHLIPQLIVAGVLVLALAIVVHVVGDGKVSGGEGGVVPAPHAGSAPPVVAPTAPGGTAEPDRAISVTVPATAPAPPASTPVPATDIPAPAAPAIAPPSATTPVPATAPLPTLGPLPQSIAGYEVGRDAARLPSGVANMRAAILAGLQSGRVEDLREAIELNELKPDFGGYPGEDPIATLKRLSRDGEGREVMAALAEAIAAGWARIPVRSAGPAQTSDKLAKGARAGKSARPPSSPVPETPASGPAMYVWPYFADIAWSSLTPAERETVVLQLPSDTAAVLAAGKRYPSWRLGIADDGTWQFFVRE